MTATRATLANLHTLLGGLILGDTLHLGDHRVSCTFRGEVTLDGRRVGHRSFGVDEVAARIASRIERAGVAS